MFTGLDFKQGSCIYIILKQCSIHLRTNHLNIRGYVFPVSSKFILTGWKQNQFITVLLHEKS